MAPLLVELLQLRQHEGGWQSETVHDSNKAVLSRLRSVGRTVEGLRALQSDLQMLRLRVPMVTEFALRDAGEANQLQVEMLHLRRMLKVRSQRVT